MKKLYIIHEFNLRDKYYNICQRAFDDFLSAEHYVEKEIIPKIKKGITLWCQNVHFDIQKTQEEWGIKVYSDSTLIESIYIQIYTVCL